MKRPGWTLFLCMLLGSWDRPGNRRGLCSSAHTWLFIVLEFETLSKKSEVSVSSEYRTGVELLPRPPRRRPRSICFSSAGMEGRLLNTYAEKMRERTLKRERTIRDVNECIDISINNGS
jgi:hypothetical protein